jgi:hypothetical protein
VSTPLQTRAIGRLKFIIAVGSIASGVLFVSLLSWKRDDRVGAPLAAIFRNYEKSEDGTNVVAVMWLTNSSERTFEYFYANGISSNGTDIVRCEFSEQTGKGWTNWIPPMIGPPYIRFTLAPHSGTLVAAPLPEEGRILKVAVLCIEPTKRLSGISARLRRLWWRVRPPRIFSVSVWCDAELSYPQQKHTGSP